MSSTRRFSDSPQFKIMRSVMGAANPLLRRALDSRFSGPLGRGLMLLEFRGRRSGMARRTPVGYVREGRRLVAVTSPEYRWWRNVEGGADVRVRLPDGWHAARAELLLPDDPRYDEAVALNVSRRPGMLRAFGVEVGPDGRLTAEARRLAPSRAHIVLFDLQPAASA